MGLDQRLAYLLLGCFIGFILGYIARSLRDIEEKVTDIDNLMHKGDEGMVSIPKFRKPNLKDFLLFFVVALVAFSSFQSQKVSNEVKVNSDHNRITDIQVQKIVYCNQVFLQKTIGTLNERTTYTVSQAQANIDLQKRFSELLGVLTFKPPKSEIDRSNALDLYFLKLKTFIQVNQKAINKTVTNPFPTVTEFTDCLDMDLNAIKKEIVP